MEPLEQRKLFAVGIGSFAPATATWSLRSVASAGPADVGTFQFGAPVPVVGDWNGDGRDDIGSFNRNTATWSLRYGASAGTPDAGVFIFGSRGALPVVGDWNGDGRDDIGVYVPGTGTWSLRLGASAGPANAGTFKFGSKNLLPVAGDWDGDGRDGIGAFSAGSATWMLRQTATAGAADAGTFKFGGKNTYPIVGDWNGDKRDGVGVVDQKTATWNLRQIASAGVPDAGTFKFGTKNLIPVAGDWTGPAVAAQNTLATVTLKPLDLNLLGLDVTSSPITVTISSKAGDGNILGNLLNSVGNIVNTAQATSALNNVLSTAVDLVNSSQLSLIGLQSGNFDTAAPSTTQIMELFVAPIHTETMGVQIDTSPMRLSISAHAGDGLVLGNAMAALSNLFNPPLPDQFNIDVINQQLSDVLGQLNTQLGSIPAATVPVVQPNAGDALTFAVPQLDMNLLGLELITDPVTFDASAETGDGLLLGNVWTTALGTLNATPDKMAQMSNTVNGVLARVIGALNASSLTVAPAALDALTPAMQTLLLPTLISPAGSSAQILDLVPSALASAPPATVSLLGLSVANNNFNAQLLAHTGDGQVLGNLLYNAANLANPGGPTSLLSLMGQLASGSTAPVAPISGPFSSSPSSSTQLYSITLPAMDMDLLGLEVQTGPITVSLTAQSGDSLLLGNVLKGYSTLLNLDTVNGAVNNVLSTTANLVNSVDLSVSGVGSGAFDTSGASTTQLLDATVAPVHMDLLGAQVDTGPIHLIMTAHSGDGLVLGNALTNLSNLFNPPLPSSLDITTINANLEQLLGDLNAQIPGIAPAALPASAPVADDVLGVTVPALDLDLLGMGFKTDPIFLDAIAHTGNGLLLGNVFTTAMNTLSTTTADLATVSGNVNAVLAKAIGVFNASTMSLPSSALASLPSAFQTLASPTLVSPVTGAKGAIFDLNIGSSSTTPTSAGLLGLNGTTSNIHLILSSHTGDGLILGNMLYNVANLLNSGSSSNFLDLLEQLAA